MVLTCKLTHDLDLGFSRSTFEMTMSGMSGRIDMEHSRGHILRIVGWIDVKNTADITLVHGETVFFFPFVMFYEVALHG